MNKLGDKVELRTALSSSESQKFIPFTAAECFANIMPRWEQWGEGKDIEKENK